MENKLLGLLGLCRRAGKLTLGFDATKDAVLAKSATLVLVTEDSSERTSRECERLSKENGCAFQKLPFSMEAVHVFIGKRSAVLGVCDAGFSGALQKALRNSENNL